MSSSPKPPLAPLLVELREPPDDIIVILADEDDRIVVDLASAVAAVASDYTSDWQMG